MASAFKGHNEAGAEETLYILSIVASPNSRRPARLTFPVCSDRFLSPWRTPIDATQYRGTHRCRLISGKSGREPQVTVADKIPCVFRASGAEGFRAVFFVSTPQANPGLETRPGNE